MPQLVRDGRALARADLRYTNGFALVWRAPAAPPAAAPAATPSVVPPAAPRAAAVANVLTLLPRIPAFPS
jgi:cell division protein FtsQ